MSMVCDSDDELDFFATTRSKFLKISNTIKICAFKISKAYLWYLK